MHRLKLISPQIQDGFDRLIEIYHTSLTVVFASEGEEVPHDPGRPPPCLVDTAYILLRLLAHVPARPQQLRVAHHRLQRVVQFVSHAGDGLAQGGELLSM